MTRRGVYDPEVVGIKYVPSDDGGVLVLTLVKSITITVPFRPIEQAVAKARGQKKTVNNVLSFGRKM